MTCPNTSLRVLVVGGLVLLSGCQAPKNTARLEANNRWNKARADVKVQLAADQFEAGNFDAAAGELATATELDPDNPHHVPLHVRILLSHGKTRAAARLLERALVENPRDPENMYLLGVVRQQQQRWEEALAAFREAAALAPDDVSYAVAATQAMLQLGQAGEALAFLLETAPRFDWTTAYQAMLAECHEQLGNWSAAASAWQRVSFNRGEDAEILERTATALYHARRYIEAIAVLEQLVNERGILSPKIVRLMLAECCLEVGRTTDARQQVEHVLTADGQSLRALRLLARCHAAQSDHQTALAVVRRALDIDRNDTRCLELAAALAWRLAQPDRAANYVDRLLALDADNPVAIQLRQRLELSPAADPTDARLH